jgi:signal transduction histidine kinase
MDTPTLLQSVTMITNLLTVSMTGGLVFSTLARPKRAFAHWLFALFALTLGGWALVSFVLMLRVLDSPNEVGIPVSLINLRAGLMVVWALTFYGFVVQFFKVHSRIPRVAALASFIIGLLLLILIGTGQWMTLPLSPAEDVALLQSGLQLPLTALGVIAFAVLSLYLGLAFWVLFSSANSTARLWVLPGALLFQAAVVNVIQSSALSSLDSLLVMVAAVSMTWSLMWYQPFNPLTELNAELRTANRDLQQVANELALEKNRTEVLNAELRASNEYKTGFLSNLSHELRTPLNSIIGYSELLRNNLYGTLNEKQADRLEKIHRNGTHLLEIIGHILELNRLEAGKLQLQIHTFDLRDVLLRCHPRFEEQVRAANLEYTLRVPETPLTLVADPERVEQIIQNLVRNAIMLTGKGGITLTAAPVNVSSGISTSSDGFDLPAIGWLRDGPWVLITITDTGRGIAQEEQARIFEEFAQIEGAYPEEYGGSGLLLALTKRLIMLHDGVIWVKSRVGAGSSFFVALPVDVQTAKRRSYNTQLGEGVRQ